MPNFKLSALILILVYCAGTALPVMADTSPQVTDPQVEYLFGESVTFSVQVSPHEGIQRAWILIRPLGQTSTLMEEAQVGPGGRITYRYDLSENSLPAFSVITYWFRITWENGEEYTMDTTLPFLYADNRFDWQSMESEHFRLQWYEGDLAFAQGILDTAETALVRVSGMLFPNMEMVPGGSAKIHIYVYARAADLHATLRRGGHAWVAGHANPELNIVLLSLDPERPETRLESERQIPHEISHILLYRLTGSGYRHLPTWMNEGFASTNELFPNPDYPLLLENAYPQNLLSFSSLCTGFPTDASQVILAYAQADSFTRYLVDRFGNSGLQRLAREYADGKGCEFGVQAAFDLSLEVLERQWRQQTFAENRWLAVLREAMPGLVLMGVLIGPLLLAGGLTQRNRGQKTGGHSSSGPKDRKTARQEKRDS